MKRVLIIYTGGTIGMTRTENGYAPRAGYFRAALDAIPDLRARRCRSGNSMNSRRCWIHPT
mgnify:CR=1 FL=1